MEKQARKAVHITWEEAHRAEAEREKARQTRCRSLPPNWMQVVTGYVSRDLSKLRTSARRVALENEPQRKIYFARGPTKSEIAVFGGIILLVCVGTMFYLQQGKNYVFHPAVKWGAIAQQGLRNTSNPEVIIEASKTQPVTPQLSSTNYESAQPDDRESTAKRALDHLGNFEVVHDSFVRDKPQPNANIIATLRPGTQIRVESKTEEYLRIRSLSDADVIGYVHEEDAFFQAIK